ncbi:beta-lactamase family protein [Streptomyces sp. NBC_01433]|uniref:serine hydrolase domain-containing protein n=1 Tax=Streptomyces sp. NBC_01433 TaxID=2903864 RepID=UPI0022514207|nr:serine hydrolase domain-containing protein [Streptomyces sp. NBC_01433]MCX4679355.1 beta-lactamase family protein [Streptomyces sp. NBC_01433]
MRPTGAVLMTRDGVVVHEVYTGTDPATGARRHPGTRFQIASLSKQFVAATALLLAEDGVLSLTDRLADGLPGCPPAWAALTLHHLLTHTSGLPHWDAVPEPGPHTSPSRGDTLARIMRLTLLSAPGDRWHYSSPGYVLAALMIEHAGARAYTDILRERILLPLRLNHTGTSSHRAGAQSGTTDLSCLPGTGDLWSTAHDLARWARVLEQSELLNPGSLRSMYTPHAIPRTQYPTPLIATGYGYGVFLGTLAGHPAHFHHGDNPGHRSLLVRLPEQDTGIVVLTRDDDTDPCTTLPELLTALAQHP